jgi:hypothetical protein
VTAPQGSLIGDFAAERVIVALPGSEDRILIDGLRWQGLALARAQAAPAWLRIEARAVHAARVELRLALAAGSSAPQGLESPVELALEAIDIGEFVAPPFGEQPLRALHARIAIGADGGRLHRIDGLASSGTAWSRTAAADRECCAAEGAGRPGDRVARERLPDRPRRFAHVARRWRSALQARCAARHAARSGQRRPGRCRATRRRLPTGRWRCWLRTQALGLAALHSVAPARRRLAQLRSSASDRPPALVIALVNARAGATTPAAAVALGKGRTARAA